MNISGFTFRKVNGNSYYSGPGVFLYFHQETGKYFVRALRNSKIQRSKKNYPKQLKELLKVNNSAVVLSFAEIEKDTKEAVYLAEKTVQAKLAEIDKLYKRPKPQRGGNEYAIDGQVVTFTVWCMTHLQTGAVYYFEDITGVAVQDKVAQRLRTFNNYVKNGIINKNRIMHQFTKLHYPLFAHDWVIRDLCTNYPTEQQALNHISRVCKKHLEASEIVLNRICNTDSLYYRNALLKLPHVSVEQYLKTGTVAQ